MGSCGPWWISPRLCDKVASWHPSYAKISSLTKEMPLFKGNFLTLGRWMYSDIPAAGLSWAELRQKQTDTEVVRRETSDLGLSVLELKSAGWSLFCTQSFRSGILKFIWETDFLWLSALSRAVQFLFAPFQAENNNQPIQFFLSTNPVHKFVASCLSLKNVTDT